MKYWAVFVGTIALFASTQASAGFINFEDASTHSLNDDDEVTTQYNGTDGVTFEGAYLEQIGETSDQENGFGTGGGVLDKDLSTSGNGLGTWFLRTKGSLGSRGPGSVFLAITYDTSVTQASGQIWDIDGLNKKTASEQWLVKAFDDKGTLDTSDDVFVTDDLSPLGYAPSGTGSLNGLPWTFKLTAGTSFNRIEFIFKGTKDEGIGLAFDNFNTTSSGEFTAVPEPATVWLFALGMICLALGFASRRHVR